MSIQSDFCDISYDNELEKIEDIKRLPWVGKSYRKQNTKLLILGESVYDWNPEDPLNIENINTPSSLRNLHKNHALNFKRNSKFVRNIERAIYGKKQPTDCNPPIYNCPH